MQKQIKILVFLLLITNLTFSQTTLHSFFGHFNSVRSVKFSPDGRYIVSGSVDRTIKVWRINDGMIVRNFIGHKNYVNSVCFSNDANYIVSGSSDSTVRVWDIRNVKQIKILKGHNARVSSVALSPNNEYIASGGWDNLIKIWRFQTGQELKTLKGHTGYVRSVAFSPDGKYIISGSDDGSIKIWGTETGMTARTLKGHTKTVYSVKFNAQGTLIASGSGDNSIIIWDATSGKRLKTLRGHTDFVRSVCFSPDGKYLISGSDDKLLKMWDIETGNELMTFTGHSKIIYTTDISVNQSYIVSGSWDKAIKLWKSGIENEKYQQKIQAEMPPIIEIKPIAGRINKPIDTKNARPNVEISTYKLQNSQNIIKQKEMLNTLTINIINTGKKAAQNVTINLITPPLIQKLSPTYSEIGNLLPGESKKMALKFIVPTEYNGSQILIKAHLNEAEGMYSNDRDINLYLPHEQVVTIDSEESIIEWQSPSYNDMVTSSAFFRVTACVNSKSEISDFKFYLDELLVMHIIYGETSFSGPDCDFFIDENLILQPGINNLRIKSTNKFGTTTSTIRVNYDISTANYYALLIAGENYTHLDHIPGNLNNINKLGHLLSANYTFDEENVIFLQNPQKNDILKTISDLEKQMTFEDNLLVYYSGHSFSDNDTINENSYWLTREALPDDKNTWLSNTEFIKSLNRVRAHNIFLVSDGNFSNTMIDTLHSYDENININQLYETTSRKIIINENKSDIAPTKKFDELFVEYLINNSSKFLSTGKLYFSIRNQLKDNKLNTVYGTVKNLGDEEGDFIFIRK